MTTELGNHISQQFNKELEDIRNKVLLMGGIVEQQLSDACKGILEGNHLTAESVLIADKEVNHLEVSIDEECTSIIARRQPTASDLRLIMVVIKMIADLERIGDESKRIAKMALSISKTDSDKSRISALRHLFDYAKDMLHKVLDAFARMDTEAGFDVFCTDKQLDREYESIMRQMITYMMEDPRSIPWAINLLWSARALERIGDRCANISEYIIYFVKGKDVRHISDEEIKHTIKE